MHNTRKFFIQTQKRDRSDHRKHSIDCVSRKSGQAKKEHFLLLPLRGDGEVICRFIFKRMRLELNDKIDSFFYSSVSRFIAWAGRRRRRHAHIFTSTAKSSTTNVHYFIYFIFFSHLLSPHIFHADKHCRRFRHAQKQSSSLFFSLPGSVYGVCARHQIDDYHFRLLLLFNSVEIAFCCFNLTKFPSRKKNWVRSHSTDDA